MGGCVAPFGGECGGNIGAGNFYSCVGVKMVVRWLWLICAVAVLGSASGAQAQVNLSPRTAPSLGTTIRGSSATTFSISNTGAVSRLSGDAIRLSNSSVTVPTVSFNCGLLNLGGLCALRPVRITIAPASTDPVAISKFRVSGLRGGTYRTGAPPADAQIIVFDLNAIGLLSTVSFNLSMDVVLQGGAASGVHSFPYTVTVQLL